MTSVSFGHIITPEGDYLLLGTPASSQLSLRQLIREIYLHDDSGVHHLAD